MAYAEKLKDPRWQKKRLEILQRDEWKCRLCGNSNNQLHVHHLCYESEPKDPWDYDNCVLISLCDEHHSMIHKSKVYHEFSMIVLNTLLIFMNVSYLDFIKSFANAKTDEEQLSNVRQFIIDRLTKLP